MNELNVGDYPEKKEILRFAFKFKVLKSEQMIIDIAEIYIKNYLMPKDYEGDALHLANANKKEHIRIINSKLGLAIPEIITPLELFSEQGI